MERKQATTTLFLLALSAIALYFCYVLAKPFLSPVFLAVMVSIVFHPVHARIQAYIHGRDTAALISTILVLLALIVPVAGLGVVVSQEIKGLYELLNERSAAQGGWYPWVMRAMDRLAIWAGRYVDLSSIDLRGAVMRWLEQISRSLVAGSAWAASNIISFVANAVITLFTLFFLFREGRSMRKHAEKFLPLNQIILLKKLK